MGNFKVEANSREEALEIAKENYYSGEFVNEPGELVEKKIAVRTNKEDFGVWEEM